MTYVRFRFSTAMLFAILENMYMYVDIDFYIFELYTFLTSYDWTLFTGGSVVGPTKFKNF